ncbi:serine hydrolase [Pseudogemmatithrix spongiicola]|uniref:Serine hydrolase n=1 Tax=Pseudogemmatithrix spongiicola TaxID=3062599 RepID=A0AA49K1M8_9BACT|nr:serine hydrolase [Gemmatimonadaceae bacterium 'strain 138']WKW16117.1 serine hydrolase [Gemmatimonadaceae bacterium 'strain 318']
MMHKIAERGVGALLTTLVILAALMFGGLALLTRDAAAQTAPTTDWQRQLDSAVTAEMARTMTPGVQVAVVHQGRVIYAKAYGAADVETSRPLTNASLLRIGSVTKMVTGAVAAELAEQGKLDLRAPISRYVPSLEGKRVGTVTTHQLLTHTAGWLDNAVAYGRMGEGALGEVMREVTDTMFSHAPGAIISYSNPGFSMAGYVIERAAGERYASITDRMILRPVGMPHATFRPLEAMVRDFSQGHMGMPGRAATMVRPFTENTAQWAAGFLMASATDMARFAAMLMDGGVIDGQRVISEGAVRRMTTPDPRIPGDSTARYAYGLVIAEQQGLRIWQHGGSINGFDAIVNMFPDEKLAVVVLDNRSGPSVSGALPIVFRGVTGRALPASPAPPSAERLPTADERRAVVGQYKFGPMRIEIAEQGDSLVFRQAGASFGVRMLGNDRMKVMVPPMAQQANVLLVRGADGRVAFLHQGLRAIPRVEP